IRDYKVTGVQTCALPISGGLNTLQFESIAVHPTDQFLMIGGTQDNGTEFQQTSSGNWRRAESGDGGYALIDQSATDTTNVTMYQIGRASCRERGEIEGVG